MTSLGSTWDQVEINFPVGRSTYLTILEMAWSVNFKMVWYDLLQPLKPELNGQDPFQICEACVKLEKRRL
jgi:hypothetical protein